MTVTTALKITGTGLITGLPVDVQIEEAPPGHGIVFYLDGELPVPARLESVVHTDRGVTLAHPTGKTLSIVEHFLCACSMAGLSDLKVSVSGPAPELPLLDGSALPWLTALQSHFGQRPIPGDLTLQQALFYRHHEDICLYAIPAPHFQVSYAVDFDHPGLKNRWVRWDSRQDDLLTVASARTFGYTKELPLLQAQGLAKGVTLENTLGLTEEGGYTHPLRIEDEPVYHKLLDLIGDFTLMGLNPMRLNAHVFAINAGHGSHTAFARKLLKALP